MAKAITIECTECGRDIIMSAEDAKIRWKFNGGCPCNVVTVKCPHCNQMGTVKPTPEARKLLARRIQNSIKE